MCCSSSANTAAASSLQASSVLSFLRGAIAFSLSVWWVTNRGRQLATITADSVVSVDRSGAELGTSEHRDGGQREPYSGLPRRPGTGPVEWVDRTHPTA